MPDCIRSRPPTSIGNTAPLVTGGGDAPPRRRRCPSWPSHLGTTLLRFLGSPRAMAEPGNECDDSPGDHAEGTQPGHPFSYVVTGRQLVVWKPPLPGFLVEDGRIPLGRQVKPSVDPFSESHKQMMPKGKPSRCN